MVIKLKSILLTLVLSMSLSYVSLFSQTKSIDSLKNIIETNKMDSTKVSNLNELSIKILNENNIAGSLLISQEAFDLAKKINFLRGKAYALKNMGMAEYYQGNYQKVLEYWTQSIETFESIPDTLGIANMTNNLGVVYYSQSSFGKAIDYYLQSLAISEKLNDPLRICTALLNIGGVYFQLKNYDKALNYYNQIEPYIEKFNDPQITSAYLMGTGEIYSEKKDFDKALINYEKALPLNINTPDYAHNLTMMGKMENEKGNRAKAISYLQQAYETAKLNNLQLDIIQTLTVLAKMYQTEDFERAFYSYKEAENLALEMGVHGELKDIYEGLSKAYEAKSDFVNAFKYQTLLIQQKDSIFNIATDDKVRGLQFDFDLEKKQNKIGLLEKEAQIQIFQVRKQKYFTYASLATLAVILILAVGFYRRYRFIKKTNLLIEEEKNRSETLLRNILPDETALELKKYGKVEAKKFDAVTVMFTDFIGFTGYSADLSPEDLVHTVDYYFSKFDAIIEKYGLEKIKTIGDSYMCAGGLPMPSKNMHINVVKAAIEIKEFVIDSQQKRDDRISPFDIRIGINTGPVVAGVVGTKKFAYDIWGDTVNVAARMESSSRKNMINISANTYDIIQDNFDCSYRGKINVKNKGEMNMYFVNGEINDASSTK